MAVMDALNQKYGPAPLWVWGLGTAVIGGAYLIHRKNKAASAQQSSTQAAADQTNTNLGSASELANMFEVAGLMPYQGGDTYVNVSGPAGGNMTGKPIKPGGPPGPWWPVNPPPPKTTTGSSPVDVGTVTAFTYQAQKNDTWASIASRYGISAQHLQNYNAVASNRGGLGSINTNAKVTPGEQIVIPWLNK